MYSSYAKEVQDISSFLVGCDAIVRIMHKIRDRFPNIHGTRSLKVELIV